MGQRRSQLRPYGLWHGEDVSIVEMLIRMRFSVRTSSAPQQFKKHNQVAVPSTEQPAAGWRRIERASGMRLNRKTARLVQISRNKVVKALVQHHSSAVAKRPHPPFGRVDQCK